MFDQNRMALINLYRTFLENIKDDATSLLGSEFSNPYYSSIPENWYESTGPRIMVVGEEGFGTWGCGKGDPNPIAPEEIERIQQLNYDYLRVQLLHDEGKLNNSAFWKRFRKISKYGICCWTNIDKIHRLASRNCALSKKERELLHSVKTRVLAEEIAILDPTHILFFGWHGDSLKHELPDIYSVLYPGGKNDKSVYDCKVVPIEYEDRTYIFAYHPNWGYRNKGYEDSVLDTLRKFI